MKILLIADVPNWAWDHKANALIRNLKNHVDKIDKIFISEFRSDILNKFDLFHFFGWIRAIPYANKSTVGISSYNYRVKYWKEAKKSLKKFLGVSAVSKDIFNNLKENNLNNNIAYLPNGVDEEIFYPKKIKNNNKFTIGWVGQPTNGILSKEYNTSNLNFDQHGYTNIFKPLIKKFENNNKIIFKELSNTYENAIPHPKMNDFYNSCDCIIHTGYLTGTPNPIFEAASCAIPVVSTKIGEAINMIEDGVNGYLIDSYSNKQEAENTINKFVEKLTFLSKNRDMLNFMGEKGREIILKDWTWKKRALDYLPFFRRYCDGYK